jgi:hypothetical protein
MSLTAVRVQGGILSSMNALGEIVNVGSLSVYNDTDVIISERSANPVATMENLRQGRFE